MVIALTFWCFQSHGCFRVGFPHDLCLALVHEFLLILSSSTLSELGFNYIWSLLIVLTLVVFIVLFLLSCLQEPFSGGNVLPV